MNTRGSPLLSDAQSNVNSAATNKRPRGRRSRQAVLRRMARFNHTRYAARQAFRRLRTRLGCGDTRAARDALRRQRTEEPRTAPLAPQKSFTVGTHNTDSLVGPVRQGELTYFCYSRNISILAVQEHQIRAPSSNGVQWKDLGLGWRLAYVSAPPHPRKGGVGFLVAPNIPVQDIGSPHERIIWMKTRTAGGSSVTYVSVYAPHAHLAESTHASFYSALNAYHEAGQ